MVAADTTEELIAAVRAADAAGQPVLLVGGGSNLLVADAGFPGSAILVRTRGIEVTSPTPDDVEVTVAAGEPWEPFVAHAVGAGWSGLEALSGIPGSTGATPIQNVGAYGVEVSRWVTSMWVLDRRTGEVGALPAPAAGFGYRTSALKRSPGDFVVLSVTLRLPRDPRSAPIGYAELARVLGVPVGTRVPSAQVRAAVLELRRGKGMLLDPADHDTWSAGSFFTNPILTPEQAEALPVAAPRFVQADGVKTSAAWLITRAGFPPGFAVRPGAPAALSGKHALALTNRGGASAADLVELARTIRAGVADRFGIVLEPEPVLVGCAL